MKILCALSVVLMLGFSAASANQTPSLPDRPEEQSGTAPSDFSERQRAVETLVEQKNVMEGVRLKPDSDVTIHYNEGGFVSDLQFDDGDRVRVRYQKEADGQITKVSFSRKDTKISLKLAVDSMSPKRQTKSLSSDEFRVEKNLENPPSLLFRVEDKDAFASILSRLKRKASEEDPGIDFNKLRTALKEFQSDQRAVFEEYERTASAGPSEEFKKNFITAVEINTLEVYTKIVNLLLPGQRRITVETKDGYTEVFIRLA